MECFCWDPEDEDDTVREWGGESGSSERVNWNERLGSAEDAGDGECGERGAANGDGGLGGKRCFA